MVKLIRAVLLLFIISACSDKPVLPENDEERVIAYPNATTDVISISILRAEGLPIRIRIFDPRANQIFETRVEAGEKYNSFQFSLKDYAVGTYQLIVEIDSIVTIRKFIRI